MNPVSLLNALADRSTACQTPVEQARMAAALRFERAALDLPALHAPQMPTLQRRSEPLTPTMTPGISLQTVPKTQERPKLSLTPRPGRRGVEALEIAILVAAGMVGQAAMNVHAALFAQGANPRFVGLNVGPIATADGVMLEADASFRNPSGFLFDGLVLPDGEVGVSEIATQGTAMDFVTDQYRHAKPLLVMGAASKLLNQAGLPIELPNGQADPGIVVDDGTGNSVAQFCKALAAYRQPEAEFDSPQA